MSTIATIPNFSIETDGAAFSADAIASVETIRISQRLSAPTQCEIVFGNALQNEVSRGDTLRLGIKSQSSAFVGEVIAVEREYQGGGWRTRIRAYDRLHTLRKHQPVRVHVQVALTELTEELVRDLGITVSGTVNAPLWERYIQYGQSDLDLLLDLAERVGVYFTLHDDTLHLITLEPAQAEKTLVLGRDLLEASVELNANDSCEATSVQGWDPSHITSNHGDAGSGSGDGTSRTEVLRLAPDASHSSALAQKELARRRAAEVTLWGLAEGDPQLRPGTVVSVSGGGAGFDANHILTSVIHNIDRERGYTSEISSELPARRAVKTGFFVTPGRVTRIDDSENLGRIRAALTTCSDLETDWMTVIAPMAGKGKGFMSVPDVGDEVLCCCSAENPAYGVVLGPVYGTQGVPDCGIENGAVARFTLRTPGGHRLQFDDAKRTLRLETELGSFVQMSPLTMTVHAATDLTLEAPGHAVVVRGQRIDFQRG